MGGPLPSVGSRSSRRHESAGDRSRRARRAGVSARSGCDRCRKTNDSYGPNVDDATPLAASDNDDR